jgi:cytidine deaminase
MSSVDWEALFRAATEVRLRAHAPYSKFRVGAAVLGEDGRIYPGCNVENASYGLSACAERNAIAQAVAQGNRKVTAVAVVAESAEPTPPCGMCRQVVAEFGSRETPVRMRNLTGKEASYRLDELLPHAFTREFL